MTNKRLKNKVDFVQPIVGLMKLKGLWSENLAEEIPSTVENYGGLLLFSSPSFTDCSWHEAGDDLWALVCELFKGDRVAIKGRIKNDRYRSPQAQLVYGTSSLATFTDNGINYRWDVEKTMFSRGNVTERHRIARLDCRDEIIVDLFAGIGYFTVPYLVHAGAEHVHACEWNPDAVTALRDNLELNGVADRCTIYNGDNRLMCPKKIANRVNLGLIPSAENHWETACQALVPSGGLLYVHHNVESFANSKSAYPGHCSDCLLLSTEFPNVEKNSLLPVQLVCRSKSTARRDNDTVRWKRAEWFYFSLHLSHVLLTYLESYHGSEWCVSVVEVFKVKSYAPHVDHLVLAVNCRPVISS